MSFLNTAMTPESEAMTSNAGAIEVVSLLGLYH
jgi:hypothetical protein